MPEITLVSHDGFVKQVVVPYEQYRAGVFRIAATKQRPWQDFTQNSSVFDLDRQVTFYVRDFVREGQTTVFKER